MDCKSEQDIFLLRNCLSVLSHLALVLSYSCYKEAFNRKKCFNSKQEKNQCFDLGLVGISLCEAMIFKFGDFGNMYHKG